MHRTWMCSSRRMRVTLYTPLPKKGILNEIWKVLKFLSIYFLFSKESLYCPFHFIFHIYYYARYFSSLEFQSSALCTKYYVLHLYNGEITTNSFHL